MSYYGFFLERYLSVRTRAIRMPIATMNIRASGSFLSEDGRSLSDFGSSAPANPV